MRFYSLVPHCLIECYQYLRDRVKEEHRFKDSNLSLMDKIWLWRNGFTSGGKVIYGLTRKNVHLYLDSVRYKRMHPLNGFYSKLIDNKAFLPLICPYVPSLYIIVEEGLVRCRKGLKDEDLLNGLVNYMAETSEELICKPLASSGGSGLRRLNEGDVEGVVKELLASRCSFIISNCVVQSEYSGRIFDGSVNTIRLIIYRDVDTRRMTLKSSHHRFGTIVSQPADNTMRGGVMASINLKTGIMGKAFGDCCSKYSGWHSVHPDTGSVIEGSVIPKWEERLKMIMEYFDSLSWLEYAGPDIVLTDTGFLVLEINSLPGIHLAQVDKPYLADNGLRRFFLSKGLHERK